MRRILLAGLVGAIGSAIPVYAEDNSIMELSMAAAGLELLLYADGCGLPSVDNNEYRQALKQRYIEVLGVPKAISAIAGEVDTLKNLWDSDSDHTHTCKVLSDERSDVLHFVMTGELYSPTPDEIRKAEEARIAAEQAAKAEQEAHDRAVAEARANMEKAAAEARVKKAKEDAELQVRIEQLREETQKRNLEALAQERINAEKVAEQAKLAAEEQAKLDEEKSRVEAEKRADQERLAREALAQEKAKQLKLEEQQRQEAAVAEDLRSQALQEGKRRAEVATAKREQCVASIMREVNRQFAILDRACPTNNRGNALHFCSLFVNGYSALGNPDFVKMLREHTDWGGITPFSEYVDGRCGPGPRVRNPGGW